MISRFSPTDALAHLQHLWESSPVALLVHQNEVFYSTYPVPQKPLGAKGWTAPHSALTQLIQGMYEHTPTHALKHLRERIWINDQSAPSRAMDALMIAVSARKVTTDAPWATVSAGLTGVTHFTEIRYTPSLPMTPEPLPPTLTPETARDHLAALVATIKPGISRAQSNRKIAAILVDRSGTPRASAISTNGQNRTQHAEINLVQHVFARTGQALPAGTTIYTSLKPCRMCAAMLIHCCEDPKSLRVHYLDFDPGPQGRSTLFNADSPDRRRFFPEWSPEVGELESPL